MHEQEEPSHNRAGHREEETHADLSAGTATADQREPGCPSARTFGSRTAVLQCPALRRAAPTEEDASRSGLASGSCALSFPETGTSNRLWRAERAVWVF